MNMNTPKEPETVAGPGGATVAAATAPSTPTKDVRDMARQWDQEDRLAKKQSNAGKLGKAVPVGATAVRVGSEPRTPERKYGLRRPGSTFNAPTCVESQSPSPVDAKIDADADTSSKLSFNFLKVHVEEEDPEPRVPFPPDANSPASAQLQEDADHHYMVQAHLVSESNLKSEETNIPQAEIVDLQPKKQLICIPESNRGWQ